MNKSLVSEEKSLGTQASSRVKVEAALRERVERRQLGKIIESFGQIDYEANYDYKTARLLRSKRGQT